MPDASLYASADRPTDALAEWCREQVGAFRVVGVYSQAHGESQVWRIATASGDAYLKRLRKAVKWQQETDAYRLWASVALPDETATLRASADNIGPDGERAIITSALAGVCMESVTLTPAQDLLVWERAGRAIARLQSLPSIAPPADPVVTIQADFEGYLRRGRDAGAIFDTDTLALIKQAQARAIVFAGEPLVATHRDYTPRNWIVSPETGAWVGVIDWEHARPDFRTSDLRRSWDTHFRERPERESAWWQGYGTSPDDRLRTQIWIARVVGAVGTVAWAAEHNDAAFGSQGSTALLRLREEVIFL